MRSMYRMTVLLLTFAMSSSPSSAREPEPATIDAKITPATACQPWGGNPPGTEEDLVYSQLGRVENRNDSYTLGVVCPIPRDNSLEAPGVIIAYFTDRNLGADGAFECTVNSNERFGNARMDFETKVGVAAGAHQKSLAFFGIDVAFNAANYTLLCLIPPAYFGDYSSLGSYAIREWDPTDAEY